MSFKDNLKSELDYQGIQLKELSAKCGISKNTLGNYLTGHNSVPSADNAVKIAQALGVTVEYLVNGDDKNQNTMLLFPKRYRKLLDYLMELDEIDLEAVTAMAAVLQKRRDFQK